MVAIIINAFIYLNKIEKDNYFIQDELTNQYLYLSIYLFVTGQSYISHKIKGYAMKFPKQYSRLNATNLKDNNMIKFSKKKYL